MFILYSDLQASAKSDTDGFRGLGHVDSRKDTMTITFEIKQPPELEIPKSEVDGVQKNKKRQKRKDKPREDQGRAIEIEIAQDKTALRSRKGDTGSVLWKARFEFKISSCFSAISLMLSSLKPASTLPKLFFNNFTAAHRRASWIDNSSRLNMSLNSGGIHTSCFSVCSVLTEFLQTQGWNRLTCHRICSFCKTLHRN